MSKRIAKRAMVRLGVLPIEQRLTVEQEVQALDVLRSLYARWVDDGVVRWPLDNIPDALSEPVIAQLAHAMAIDFSVPDARYQRLAVDSLNGYRDICAFNEIPYHGHTAIQES